MSLKPIIRNSWREVVEDFRGSDSAIYPTPFQNGPWLSSWYDSLGAQQDIQPLPISIVDTSIQKPILGLPLIRRCQGGVDVVEFADLDITDYNAPIANADYFLDDEFVGDLRRALISVLKGHGDILQLQKMPECLANVVNPLSLLNMPQESALGSNVVQIDGEWEGYRRSLSKKFRKEIERSFRVFQREGHNARFERVDSIESALDILEQMERLQRSRIEDELGLPYLLGQPAYRDFYRCLLEKGLHDGSVVVTALLTGDNQVAAALLGIVSGDCYALVRLAQDMEAWPKVSPGKLIIERSLNHLHSQGVKRFDFTTGDYDYKRLFLVEREPLVDVILPLSVRGRLVCARDSLFSKVKDSLRDNPRVYAAIKKISPSENKP